MSQLASGDLGGQNCADDGFVAVDLGESERAGVVKGKGSGSHAEDVGGVGVNGGVEVAGGHNSIVPGSQSGAPSPRRSRRRSQ